MNKSEIADRLNEIATLLEIKGENPFKIRAYQNGARALDTLEEELGVLIEEGRLGSVKGIGKALVDKIGTFYRDEELVFYTDLKASIAPGLVEMLEIPGMGSKKVKKLHDELGVNSLPKLQEACESGAVAGLSGFGKKTAEKILTGIKNREAYGKRHLWWEARSVAQPILEGLRELPQVERAEAAGSLRRKRETVGDLDFIVASSDPEPVMDWFTGLPYVKEVTGKGSTKSSVRFEDGLQADLRVVPAAQFAFALHHFTGSKEHNVAMRSRALKRGYSLSEWGLKPEEGAEVPEVEGVDDEASLFAALDLAYVPPELREGRGEIEVAESGKLPKLVELSDIKGAFHNHTHASDGANSLEEMAAAAKELGWQYLGLADHSKASFQANGLDESRVLEQIKRIRELNEGGDLGIHLFAGIECDILKDGSMDLEDEVLAQLDYVVASVHSSFSLSEEEMTARIIRAVEHPSTTMLGHLTGRLLLRREPYAVNVDKVVDACIANRVVIEINAHPRRLDMDWRHWRKAAEKGLLTSINPDAHNTEGLVYVEAGVNAARKGWLEAETVVNTWDLDRIREFFSFS